MTAGLCSRNGATRGRDGLEPHGSIDEEATGSYLWIMRAVGLKALENKLSEYVRLAAAGEVVLITDRDRVIAELTPPEKGRSTFSGDAGLADMVRRGVLTPPTIPSTVPVPPMRPVMRFSQLMAEHDRDRQDR